MGTKEFLNHIREILDQASSTHLKPENNPLVARKSGVITESDLRRLLDFADRLDDFVNNRTGIETPIRP